MALSSHQTYYELLGIQQQAKLKEIKDAYRKMALRCHPDKDPCNPQAVAAFQKLGVAYETLSDEHRRTKYDALLSWSRKTKKSPQAAWSPQTSFNPNHTTRMWRGNMQSGTWAPSNKAQEMADQARREDDEYWSGPTYFHGAADRNAWGEKWDPEQKDRNSFKHHERHRATRKEARDKAEKDRHEEDSYGGKSPSSEPPDPDWSDKLQKEYQERIERRERKKKERSDRRKTEREQSKKDWSAELLFLLSKIISIQVDIQNARTNAEEARKAAKVERKDEDHEQIFEHPIKLKFLEERFKEYVTVYKRGVRLLRDRGQEQEANEAYVKLREARKEAIRNERANCKEAEQADLATETKTRVKLERNQAQSGVYHDDSSPSPNLTTSPAPKNRCSGNDTNARQGFKTMLPMYDGQIDDEDTSRQQHHPCEYVATPRVSYDGSDPDRGFTENTPEPSASNEEDEDQRDYELAFCNDYHNSHMEVHREFWDIVDSEHECNFCRNLCTVMRCPSCDVQACAYCKDAYR